MTALIIIMACVIYLLANGIFTLALCGGDKTKPALVAIMILFGLPLVIIIILVGTFLAIFRKE